MTTTLFGYTVLPNQEYYEEQAVLLDLQRKVRRLADLEAKHSEQLCLREDAFKTAVSDSSFYREQYARALRVIESQGHLADQSIEQLSAIEDEYLHG